MMKSLLRPLMERMKSYFFSDFHKAVRLQEASVMLLAGLWVDRVRMLDAGSDLREAEFKVFSQWGEDGIIQFLINKIPIENETFVEFGVEDYAEANTRFLLVNNNWRGLVIDSEPKSIERITTDSIHWRHDLTAICQFVTRENINEIIGDAGLTGDIGLLSIDIDGNDYWIWEAIHVVEPRIVICEYNSLFGSRHAVTVPYDASFHRTKARGSNLYFGASLPALCCLAESKGYDFLGSNLAGCNAFFIRKDLNHPFKKVDAVQGYVESQARESRDENGQLTYVSGQNRQRLIEDTEVYDIDSKKLCTLKDLLED